MRKTRRKLTDTQHERRRWWARFLTIVLIINILMSLFVIWSISLNDAFSDADFGNGMILMAVACFIVGGSSLSSSTMDPRQAAGSSGGYTPFLEAEHMDRLARTMTENMREGRRLFLYAMSSAALSLLIGMGFNLLH